jgi:transposase
MNTDARKLSWNSLTDLRKRALACIHAGQRPSEVASMYGIGRRTIYNWIALYRSGGWDALDARKRGGRPTRLDGKKMQWIYNTVVDKNPLQLKLPFALWTAKMISIVIERKFGITLSKASVCRLLAQLGITPQRPVWQAYQQKPEAVQKWLKTEYPKIKALAKKVNGEIYFSDEAGVRSDHHAGTTWAPKGCTPIVQSTGARFSLNVVSAVNAQGEFRFMVVKGTVGAKHFCSFIDRLVRSTKRMVLLIVDGHPAHKSLMVKEKLKELEDRIKMFFLPPYSPEQNPDERVWNDLKNNGIGRTVISTLDQMKRAIISYLRFIQKSPDRVKAYFTDKHVAYAM